MTADIELQPNDQLRIYIDDTDQSLITISKDWKFYVGGVELLTVNINTKEITFSDEFMKALNAQLSETIRKVGL